MNFIRYKAQALLFSIISSSFLLSAEAEKRKSSLDKFFYLDSLFKTTKNYSQPNDVELVENVKTLNKLTSESNRYADLVEIDKNNLIFYHIMHGKKIVEIKKIISFLNQNLISRLTNLKISINSACPQNTDPIERLANTNTLFAFYSNIIIAMSCNKDAIDKFNKDIYVVDFRSANQAELESRKQFLLDNIKMAKKILTKITDDLQNIVTGAEHNLKTISEMNLN